MQEDDLVLGVVIGGEARAYPHNIGWWHEIINDVVAGQATAVGAVVLHRSPRRSAPQKALGNYLNNTNDRVNSLPLLCNR